MIVCSSMSLASWRESVVSCVVVTPTGHTRRECHAPAQQEEDGIKKSQSKKNTTETELWRASSRPINGSERGGQRVVLEMIGKSSEVSDDPLLTVPSPVTLFVLFACSIHSTMVHIHNSYSLFVLNNSLVMVPLS